MNKLFFLTILLTSILSLGQNHSIEDKIIENICKDLKNNNGKHDTVKIADAFEKHLDPYLKKWGEEKADSISYSIFIRTQKDCYEFKEMLDRIYSIEDDEIIYFDKPQQSVITDEELEDFKSTKYFYYLINFEVTYLILEENQWFEFFEDKTYSKNIFKWDDRTKFTLTFVDSSNEQKKALSREGEQYHYEIISKEKDWYWVQPLKTYSGKSLNFKLYKMVKDEENE